MRLTESRTYFLSMGAYWLVFGLITTFYVRIMDLFQTSEGLAANTAFSNHVWFHGGLDILSLCVLLLALSTQPPSRTMLRAAAVAALGPTIAIAWSLVATSWWNPLFAVAGLGCFGFAVWGFLLSNRVSKSAPRVRA
jgi:nitrate reductase NapE component